MVYELLNGFFLCFHTALIVFNLFGWIWKPSRRWNLFTLLATAFSWFGLGFWYGWGYCPCTQWHWQVRRRLGYTDMPDSYIKFLIQEWTGLQVPASLVDAGTVVFFLAALAISVVLNAKDYQNNN